MVYANIFLRFKCLRATGTEVRHATPVTDVKPIQHNALKQFWSNIGLPYTTLVQL